MPSLHTLPRDEILTNLVYAIGRMVPTDLPLRLTTSDLLARVQAVEIPSLFSAVPHNEAVLGSYMYQARDRFLDEHGVMFLTKRIRVPWGYATQWTLWRPDPCTL